MPFVRRDPQGQIVAVYRNAVEDGLEAVPDTDPDLARFLDRVAPAQVRRRDWLESDLAMVRIVEDLIDALIDRGVIGFEDLPEAARAKIVQRRRRRSDLSYVQSIGEQNESGAESPSERRFL